LAILLDGDAIALLDVGASGGIIPRWLPYRENIAFTGIEPDERSIPGIAQFAGRQSVQELRDHPGRSME
jgi:2-polyprenyl-3-methyl-5-hydroxy-6-metoxy-1,4-benzoquinol methylase